MAFTLRTDAELDQVLAHLAETLQRSRHDVVVLAIQQMAQRVDRRALLEAIDDDTSERFGEALRRLGA